MTTCEMVLDSVWKMQQHLEHAYGMRPDFHITITHECRADLMSDPDVFQYMPSRNKSNQFDKIGGHGFSLVEYQDTPYRIWIAGKLH